MQSYMHVKQNIYYINLRGLDPNSQWFILVSQLHCCHYNMRPPISPITKHHCPLQFQCVLSNGQMQLDYLFLWKWLASMSRPSRSRDFGSKIYRLTFQVVCDILTLTLSKVLVVGYSAGLRPHIQEIRRVCPRKQFFLISSV